MAKIILNVSNADEMWGTFNELVKGCPLELIHQMDKVCEILEKSIFIPSNATNGEVLRIMFPNMHYTLSDKSPRVVTSIGVANSFDEDWWDAPYKEQKDGRKMELNRAIERLKLERQLAHLRLPQTQADIDLCDAIDTVLDELEEKSEVLDGMER